MHLVISDCHVTCGQDLTRFEALNAMIRDLQPETIVCLGDFASLDSMSTHHAKGSKTDHELCSLEDEINAVEQAQAKMFRKVRYRPKTVMLMGNHEERFDRFKNSNPKQVGHLAIESLLSYTQYWNDILPYKAWVMLDDISYTHIPHTIMGKPIGGVTACRTVATSANSHVVFGHTHSLNVANQPFADGSGSRMAMSAPAFMNDKSIEPYAVNLPTGWTYGCLIIRPQGSRTLPSYEYISMADLTDNYGSV